MSEKKPTFATLLRFLRKDLIFLRELREKSPNIARYVHGLPPKRVLNSLLKKIENAEKKIAKKNREISEIEENMVDLLLSVRENISDATKVAKTVLREQFPHELSRFSL